MIRSTFKNLLPITKFLAIIAFLALSLTNSQAHAQVAASLDAVTIESNPPHPAPGQNTVIKVISFSTDLTIADIVWYVDGVTAGKGTGLTSITVKTPSNSKSQAIIASIKTAEGMEIKKVITLTPADVNIVWESDGYVPPFYKGKSPYAHQGKIKFTAMPNFFDAAGRPIPANQLVYKWKSGYQVLGNESGFNKQSIVVDGNSTQDTITVRVEVSTKDSGIIGEASVAIDSSAPTIVFYKESPLYGTMYNVAAGARTSLTEKDTRIKAVPYSFSWDDKTNGKLQYTWLVNSIERSDLASSDTINLVRNEDQEGISSIGLRINNFGNILQSAQQDITAYYSKIQKASNVPEF